MTAIECINKAQLAIESALVGYYRLRHSADICNAIKYLNEAKELLKDQT